MNDNLDYLRLSIIVPVYNAEKYLRECLESMKTQNYDNFEVILIDDGSTDNSGHICDQYAQNDPRIHVFHKENGGVSSARNLGLEKAEGELITFVDADDKISSDYCRVICSNTGNYDMGCFSSHIHIEESGQDLFYKLKNISVIGPDLIQSEAYKFRDCKELNGWNLFCYPWNKVFKREIIKHHQLSFNPGLNVQEDELFATDYLRYAKSLLLLSNTLYYHESRRAGLTYTNQSYEHYLNFATALKGIVLSFTNKKWLSCELNLLFRSYWRAIVTCPYKNETKHITKEAYNFYRQARPYAQLINRKYRMRFSNPLLSYFIIKINLLLHKHHY